LLWDTNYCASPSRVLSFELETYTNVRDIYDRRKGDVFSTCGETRMEKALKNVSIDERIILNQILQINWMLYAIFTKVKL
jgi:hypothetical protein